MKIIKYFIIKIALKKVNFDILFLKIYVRRFITKYKGGGNIVKNFANLLKEYDLKVTPQRVAIVQEFHKYGHMNIDDLYKNLLDRFPSVSLATIYKNINSMVEKVFLQELKIPNSKTFYELVKNEHYHLYCNKCGYIEDIMLDNRNIIKQVSKINHFQIDSTNIILSGTCSKCCKH